MCTGEATARFFGSSTTIKGALNYTTLDHVGLDSTFAISSALINLGWKRPEAQAAVNRARARLGEGAALEGLIRDSLKELAR